MQNAAAQKNTLNEGFVISGMTKITVFMTSFPAMGLRSLTPWFPKSVQVDQFQLPPAR
jgi:hypothetical protein